MPPKARKARTTRARRVNGGSLGSWAKKAAGTVWNGVKKVGSFVKRHKIISTGLSFVPSFAGQAASVGASALGWGQKRRAVRGGSARAPRSGVRALNGRIFQT